VVDSYKNISMLCKIHTMRIRNCHVA
jgi:hypothetical protein